MNFDFNSFSSLGIGISLLATLGSFCIFAIVLGAIGFFLVRSMSKSKEQNRVAQAWPTATGTILSSGVQATRRAGRNGVSYYPSVVYQYEVNGQPFTGTRIKFGLQVGTGIRSWAENSVARYQIGAQVSVFYNPANPSDSVLER